jgi:Cu/Ag efflux protein CusF
MNRSGIIIAMLVSAVFVSFACAQPAMPAAKQAEVRAKAVQAKPRTDPPKLRGTVNSIDAKANTVTVKTKDGRTGILNVIAKTKIRKLGQAIAIKDIFEGDNISAVYRTSSGKMTATVINVKAVYPAKRAKN